MTVTEHAHNFDPGLLRGATPEVSDSPAAPGAVAATVDVGAPASRRDGGAVLRTVRDLLLIAAILMAAWVVFWPGRGARNDLAEVRTKIDRHVQVSERLDRRAGQSLAIAQEGLRVGTEARDIARESRDIGRVALGVGEATRADVARQLTISERLRELGEINDRRAASALALGEDTLRTAQLTEAQATQLLGLTTQLRDAALPVAADVDALIGLVESITGPLPASSTPPSIPAG